jgi:hypothetical protein
VSSNAGVVQIRQGIFWSYRLANALNIPIDNRDEEYKTVGKEEFSNGVYLCMRQKNNEYRPT